MKSGKSHSAQSEAQSQNPEMKSYPQISQITQIIGRVEQAGTT